MFRTPFFLSSPDILRAYPYGSRQLLGNYVAAAKAELRFPVGGWIGFEPLRGLVAYDYGTVVEELDQLEAKVASSYSAGLSLNMPPYGLNFIWAVPDRLAVGAALPDDPVFHFSLRYLYF